MPHYRVRFEYGVTGYVDVEAENEQEAINKADVHDADLEVIGDVEIQWVDRLSHEVTKS